MIYLAGPYSQPEPVENLHKVCKLATQLVDMGHLVFIPHLSAIWQAVEPRPYDWWLDLCLGYVRQCSLVVRLPGESPGADKEVEEAQRYGIPVIYAEWDADDVDSRVKRFVRLAGE